MNKPHLKNSLKHFLLLTGLIIVLAGVFVPSVTFGAECTQAQKDAGWTEVESNTRAAGLGIKNCNPPQQPGQPNAGASGQTGSDSIIGRFFAPLFKGIGYVLMTISGLILTMVGKLLDGVIQLSVIDMAKNLGSSPGIGASITTAWATLRDIANMCFIFVLLYAAFKTMFDANFGNFQTTIKNIIIVALLINFSLFFSKVVIDASNIVAIGFYKSIVSNTTSLAVNTASGGKTSTQIKGISAAYMNVLGLQNWYSPNILTNSTMSAGQVLIVGIMSSIFLLVTAVIFLISGIMFLARFIILIFLMILSPLALIAYIIPGQEEYFKKWKSSLIDQSFFAPIFFALTWVALKIADAPGFLGSLGAGVDGATKDYTKLITESTPTATALVLNYVIVIGFAIAALVISKAMATRGATGKYFEGLTGAMGANKVAGVVGGATLGGAAALGRRTIGAGASRVARNTGFQKFAGKYWIGQKALEGTEKVAKSSFDVRQTKNVGSALQKTPLGSFGAGKTGGFEKYKEDKTKSMVDTGKKFTDKDAKEAYAKRIASKWYAKGGSAKGTPGYGKTIAGTMGRSNRLAAATLLDERIKEIGTEISKARNEFEGYMGSTGQPKSTPAWTITPIIGTPTAPISPVPSPYDTLLSYEIDRLRTLAADDTVKGSLDSLNKDLNSLKTDKTSLGLDNTLKQQY